MTKKHPLAPTVSPSPPNTLVVLVHVELAEEVRESTKEHHAEESLERAPVKLLTKETAWHSDTHLAHTLVEEPVDPMNVTE